MEFKLYRTFIFSSNAHTTRTQVSQIYTMCNILMVLFAVSFLLCARRPILLVFALFIFGFMKVFFFVTAAAPPLLRLSHCPFYLIRFCGERSARHGYTRNTQSFDFMGGYY